ncbi:hypothetical protein Droror1_Dr00024063 [Drosera rotundifolia]
MICCTGLYMQELMLRRHLILVCQAFICFAFISFIYDSVIEGELLNFFKSFKAKVGVAPKGDGSLVTWTCDYEKANEEVPASELFKDFAVKTFHDLDAYLLKV